MRETSVKMEQHHVIRQTAVGTVTENGWVKIGLWRMTWPVVTHLLLESSHARVPTKPTHRHSVCGAVVVCLCVLVCLWLASLAHVHVMIWTHTSHKSPCLSSPRYTQYNHNLHTYCFCPTHMTQCAYIETHRLHIITGCKGIWVIIH